MNLKIRFDWWDKQLERRNRRRMLLIGTGPRIMAAITFFVIGVDLLLNGPNGLIFQLKPSNRTHLYNPVFIAIGSFIFSAIFAYLAIRPSKEEVAFRKTSKGMVADGLFYAFFGAIWVMMILKVLVFSK